MLSVYLALSRRYVSHANLVSSGVKVLGAAVMELGLHDLLLVRFGVPDHRGVGTECKPEANGVRQE